MLFHDATVIDNVGSVITSNAGIVTNVSLTAFNYGSIVGTANPGVSSGGELTLVNAAGASITGDTAGVRTFVGGASTFNAGTITGDGGTTYARQIGGAAAVKGHGVKGRFAWRF